ncbi:PREDICTED: protein XRI1-like [Nelumbo nucifera]|uniref:Protein XRI1-like n=2 Tax=Nelumbo nucifera TaxID=4432 RepID=A0A822YX10_NELNU|nr:PREDICTED: protein XRI1-like [Nelumbo nucifera]DAD37050.1 TPA_asm: hypothetical protein HUJ06_007691 [Nelumbo nucifera]
MGEPWEWQCDEDFLQKDSNLDASDYLWDEINQNEEDLSYMFDEATPIKACGDFSYLATESENMNKETEGCIEPLQTKRRRMLQFNTQVIDPCLCNEGLPSAFVKSKDRENSIEESLPQTSDWVSEFTGDRFISGSEGLDQSSEGWLTNCFNDAEMHVNSYDIDVSRVFDDQVHISEFCNTPPAVEANVVQECITPTPRNAFKGRKFYMRTPTKLASSVAYPFALIKPCGIHGDLTLKDINQRIRTPLLKSKHKNDDDSSASYPTSAFSGKPVVVKTKIRTEGGKGSITIMRTKG